MVKILLLGTASPILEPEKKEFTTLKNIHDFMQTRQQALIV
ncbi:hypothetical protein ACIQZG_16200 [Lysinibacillus sp. NPDC096418]